MSLDLFTSVNSSFADILGNKKDVFDEATRRKRWASFLKAARANGAAGRECAKHWVTHECAGCKHKKGAWCVSEGLPCTVNPILSFRHGVSGMACMGAGWEKA
ncbi:MAG TPA: hypothetical protein VK974_04875 [Methylophilaceae bacterium]|nr:hypothetical protein [Methylophilaceae bacterium]